ncbi:MAG: Hsp20/alpha crystallin family protein [Saprospiraceae bacterium]
MILTQIRPSNHRTSATRANHRPMTNRLTRPAVNTFETDEAYNLELSLPGWDKQEVNLKVDGEILVVTGKQEVEGELNYRRREFGLTSFEKSFHLPETVDVDGIAATLERGILSIGLPKVPAAQPVRKAIAVS